MRIASTQYHTSMNTALQMASAKVEHLMQQMASGERLLVLSDDPIASVRLGRLAREQTALDQYRDNIAALGGRLRQNEVLLDSTSRDMLQMRDLMIWAADGTNTGEDVEAMATQLVSLRDSVFATANTRDQEGRFLFSGTASNTPTITLDPLALPGARYTFTGNTDLQQVVVGNGVTQPANVALDEMAAFLNKLDLTIADFQTPGVTVSDPAVRARLKATTDLLDTTFNSVTSRIARIGGALTTMDSHDRSLANVSLSNDQAVLGLAKLDYAEAAVNLTGYTTALQATQKAYAKVSALSLFNMI